MLNTGLSAELARIQEAAEQARGAAERATTHPRDRFESMDVRLAKKLALIPDDVQRDGLSIEYLCDLVRGQRGRGSYSHVAQALRKLGWYRLRNWSRSSDGFRAYWYPPSTIQPTTTSKETNHD